MRAASAWFVTLFWNPSPNWPLQVSHGIAEHWRTGLGGLYAFDFAPSSPTASHGNAPHGAMGFVRLMAE